MTTEHQEANQVLGLFQVQDVISGLCITLHLGLYPTCSQRQACPPCSGWEGSEAAWPGVRYEAEAWWQEQAAGHGAAGKDVLEHRMWGSGEHLALVLHLQSHYMKSFLEIFIYGRGWFGLAGSLQLFLWIRAQGAAVQGQSQNLLTGPDVYCGTSGKQVWLAPCQISALPVIGLRRLSHAPDPHRGRFAGAALC